VEKREVLVGESLNPYLNLAVESALLDAVLPSEIILYLWQNERTVVIGKNQDPYFELDVNLLSAEEGYLARRRTGGGAVYHDQGNLNFSFIAGKDCYDLDAQFKLICAAVCAFGIEASPTGRNDIAADGRKFSGNAFLHLKHASLHHGTLLINTDAVKLARYLTVDAAKLKKRGVESVKSRIVNLAELNAEITPNNIAEELIKVFSGAEKVKKLSFQEIAARPETQEWRRKFESKKWLFGRFGEMKKIASETYSWGLAGLYSDGKTVAFATDGLFPRAVDFAEKAILSLKSTEKTIDLEEIIKITSGTEGLFESEKTCALELIELFVKARKEIESV
jgi:lipoate-protein ligase A